MTEKTHQQNIQIEQNSENGCALLVLFYFDGRTVLFPTNRIEIELTGADALTDFLETARAVVLNYSTVLSKYTDPGDQPPKKKHVIQLIVLIA